MTDLTTKTGDGRYEIAFRTDSEAAYKNVQEACRKEIDNDTKIPQPQACPFCGETTIEVACHGKLNDAWYGKVRCTYCGAQITKLFQPERGLTKKIVMACMVTMWNQRAKA